MHFPRRLHFTLRLGLLALVSLTVACASMPSHLTAFSLSAEPAESRLQTGDLSEISPRGPGYEFSSIDAAAIDALSYCFLAARQVSSFDRVACGGAVRPSADGFTYDEPAVARSGLDSRLRYPLGPDAVAHFRHEPRAGLDGMMSRARDLSRETRRFVDRIDVMHRPIFTLSERRIVHVYSGVEDGEQVLARVEYGARRGATLLGLRAASSTEIARSSSDGRLAIPEQPLALQELTEAAAVR